MGAAGGQAGTCGLRPAACDLRPATCDLRPAACDLMGDGRARAGGAAWPLQAKASQVGSASLRRCAVAPRLPAGAPWAPFLPLLLLVAAAAVAGGQIKVARRPAACPLASLRLGPRRRGRGSRRRLFIFSPLKIMGRGVRQGVRPAPFASHPCLPVVPRRRARTDAGGSWGGVGGRGETGRRSQAAGRRSRSQAARGSQAACDGTGRPPQTSQPGRQGREAGERGRPDRGRTAARQTLPRLHASPSCPPRASDTRPATHGARR